MSVFALAALVIAAPVPATAAATPIAPTQADSAVIAVVAGADARDPARLINAGIALARQGQHEAARARFEQAALTSERYSLATADGSWIDSRALARRALAMLNAGAFQGEARVAAR